MVKDAPSRIKSLWHILARFHVRKPEPVERRNESRLPIHGLGFVRWNAHGEGVCSDAVNLVNGSSRGLSFRTAYNLAIGQKILIRTDEHELDAVVRRNTQDGCEFTIGVEVLSCDGEPVDPAASTGPAADQAVTDREFDSSASVTCSAPIQSALHAQDIASKIIRSTASDDEDLVALSKLDPMLAFQKYQRLVKEKTGTDLTKTAFWKEANYRNRLSFQRWQKRHPKTTGRDRERFERILREKPHLTK
jgi:hypothetical protein